MTLAEVVHSRLYSDVALLTGSMRSNNVQCVDVCCEAKRSSMWRMEYVVWGRGRGKKGAGEVCR